MYGKGLFRPCQPTNLKPALDVAVFTISIKE